MKTLWILAAAATFAACHNRSEETGAAPDKGEVKSDTSMAKPATGYDTTMVKTDTTSKAQPTAPPTAPPPSAGGYDTTSTAQPTPPPSAGVGTDTTMIPKADSASTQR